MLRTNTLFAGASPKRQISTLIYVLRTNAHRISRIKKNYWVHKPWFELRHCLLEPDPNTIIHQRNRVGRVVCFRLSFSNHILKAANCCVKSPLNLYFLVLVRILFQCASAKYIKTHTNLTRSQIHLAKNKLELLATRPKKMKIMRLWTKILKKNF